MTMLQHGVRANLEQTLQQLLQVAFVGMTLGITRTVIPALAETEFGVARGSFLMLAAFVAAFGLVKGVLNFVAGRLAEHIGRKRVLLIGWLFAFPVPLLIYFAPSWSWIVAATFLLGINQGLTWSMTQTMKLDFTRQDQRGLVMGLNEFSGYLGVAVAGIVTAYLSMQFGSRTGLLWFGLIVISAATLLTLLRVKETLPWVHTLSTDDVTAMPSTREIFLRMSWQDRQFVALNQAGLVEKFVDALVWIFLPLYLYQQDVSLANIGWIAGVYGFVWGGSQLFTGKLSDHVGRHHLNVWGMWICGGGIAAMTLNQGMAWWSFTAGITGLGMAMLYPNLSAAIADHAPAHWRASAIGIYRFWRDLGYCVGAILLGLAANLYADAVAAFWFTAIAMFLSGLLLQLWGKETHR